MDTMLQPSDLKNKLRHGDVREIAEIAQCDESTVWKMFKGTRNYQTPVGKVVMAITKKIIQNREQFLDDLNL